MNRFFNLAMVLFPLTILPACDGIKPSRPPQGSVSPDAPSDDNKPGEDNNKTDPDTNIEQPGDSFLTEEQKLRNRECLPSDSSHSIPMMLPEKPADDVQTTIPVVRFTDVRSQINTACKSCHLAPMETGGFTYVDAFNGKTMLIGDREKFVPGFFEGAEQMARSLHAGTMPPASIRDTAPEAYDKLAAMLQEWIDQGRQEKDSPIGQNGLQLPAYWGLLEANRHSDVGDCVPTPEIIGDDAPKDELFALMKEVPKLLSETDLFSQDPHMLAKRGTIAYNIEYPLWSDNAGKQRWIHLPATSRNADGRPVFALPQLKEDPTGLPGSSFFEFPDNTRFYKTFYKKVKALKGDIRYYPVETRLVVVRKPPQAPLYATYVWRRDLTDADLLTAPYRDGTPWKDHVLEVDHDQTQQLTRPYFFPAKHRCENCHMGAKDGSGILGFLPIQINRLPVGEGANDRTYVGQVELNEVQRLVSYGFLEPGIEKKLIKLKDLPSRRPLQDVTIRAQGYMVGNCTHCHSQPNGFAYKNAGIKMDLSEGKIFDFNTNLTSSQFSNLKLVHSFGDLSQSYLYYRFGAKHEDLKTMPRMPMHTAAAPDCYGLTVFARWLKSYDTNLSVEEINSYTPDLPCTAANEFKAEKIPWVDEDFTEPSVYTPRRDDWQNHEVGMPSSYRDLRFDNKLAQLAKKPYAVDFWATRGKQCHLPEVKLTDKDVDPWMVKHDERGRPMKDPDGNYIPARGSSINELYFNTPGAYFFNRTCTKCHGRDGAGDGPIAKSLFQASGGTIRVANFVKGMFGNNGANIGRFVQPDDRGQPYNFGGNYFIWMAMEGTNMAVPDGMSLGDLLGPHKAKMLNSIRDACIRQIETHPKHPNRQFDREYRMLADVCLHNNNPRGGFLGSKSGLLHPDLQFKPGTEEPVNRAFLDQWADRAAINAGWTIYEYVKSQLAVGKRAIAQNECELLESAP